MRRTEVSSFPHTYNTEDDTWYRRGQEEAEKDSHAPFLIVDFAKRIPNQDGETPYSAESEVCR